MDLSVATKNIKQVLEQSQIINNIHTALSMTIKIEDIYSIILSALISKNGLDFSRSFLVVYNPKKCCFEGKYAMGPTTPEEAFQFIEEQNVEDKYLSDLLKEIDVKDHSTEFVTDLVDRVYSNLRSGSVWIALFQKYGMENELTKKITDICVTPGQQKSDKKCFLSYMLENKCATKFDIDNDPYLFPENFKDLFDKTFAAVPLKTKNGVRAIVLVDRKFSDREITYIDLKNLDWFSSHSSLAIENAELFDDLENAYHELKELEKIKNNFISIISHELRTPLTSILGFVELISKEKVGPLTVQQKELLSRVSKNTAHLVQMVNDLIQLAELEAEGIMDIRLTPVDPLSILLNIIPRFEQRRKTKRIDIEPVFTNTPPKVFSDEKQLERIFYHLLDNAIKFSKEDGKVLVRYKQEDKNLLISIEDEGIGIPEEKLLKIFDSFYQIDSSLSRTYEGLGVGLAITKLLLRSTNGQIEVISKVGAGSKFIIKYPIAE